MGCASSTFDSLAPQRKHSPIRSHLSDQDKETLSNHIDSDDLLKLAVDMDRLGAYPNSEISDRGMDWMLTHLCCRWDADNCLEFLLKEYFSTNPRGYVDLVNAPTIEGYTCLHLCSIWGSEKCLKVLLTYGGLNMAARDGTAKTAYQTAQNFKNSEIAGTLQQYQDLQINFLQVEGERLMSGDIISQDVLNAEKKIKDRVVKIDKSLQRTAGNLFLHIEEEKKLLEDKIKLQEESHRIQLQKKKKEEEQAIRKHQQMLALQYEEWERAEKEKQLKERLRQEEKKWQEQMAEQLKAKNREIQRANEELKIIEQKRLQEIRKLQMKKAEEMEELRKIELEQRKKAKEAALLALAEQQRLEQQRLAEQKKLIEQKRQAEQKLAEQQRLLEQQKLAEQQRLAELQRSAEQKLADQQRSAEQKLAEQKRLAEKNLAEQQKLLEQQRLAEKQRLLAAQQELLAAEQKKRREGIPLQEGGVSPFPAEIPAEIKAKYQQAKAAGIFVDNEFPAAQSTIGSSNNSKINSLCQSLAWLRPTQIFNSEFKLFDGIDENDIKQGSLGVCYMLASVSALAADPENIKRIFVFHDLKVGFYVLRLYKNGIPIYLVVDDLIPCNKMTKSPLFTKPIGKEIWVLLIEKAWAKMVGNYLKAESMTPDHMMEDLSGAPSFGEWFKDTPNFVKSFLNHRKLKHIIVLTTGDQKIEGIVANHAYTLLEVYEHNRACIFKIRNPWGVFQWNGEYGEKSSLWTEELKAKVKMENKDDGIFYLSESELTKIFVYYSISQVEPGHLYSYTAFKSRENENLFYTFKVTKSGSFNVRVTQPFDRMLDDKDYAYSPLIIEFGKIKSANEVQFISEGHKRTYFGAKSVHAFEDIEKKLDVGEYFLRVSMLWKKPSKYNSGAIGIYGPEVIELVKLPEDQGIKRMKQLFLSQSAAVKRNQTGKGYYKISVMKGQFVLVGETDEDAEQQITFTFSPDKMVMCEADLSKTSNSELSFKIRKNQPGVGTARRTDPSKGGTTGPMSISVRPV